MLQPLAWNKRLVSGAVENLLEIPAFAGTTGCLFVATSGELRYRVLGLGGAGNTVLILRCSVRPSPHV